MLRWTACQVLKATVSPGLPKAWPRVRARCPCGGGSVAASAAVGRCVANCCFRYPRHAQRLAAGPLHVLGPDAAHGGPLCPRKLSGPRRAALASFLAPRCGHNGRFGCSCRGVGTSSATAPLPVTPPLEATRASALEAVQAGRFHRALPLQAAWRVPQRQRQKN